MTLWSGVLSPSICTSCVSRMSAQIQQLALVDCNNFYVRCESYFACAEIDKWAPPEDIRQLEQALVEAKNKHRIEWFPKAEHGFVFPQRAV